MPFAVVVSKLMGLQDPELRLRKPWRDQRAAHRQQDRRRPDPAGRRRQSWFAVWLAEQLAPGITPVALACVVVAAFLGHLYPIFLGFKGGKGVATALGVLVAIQPGWPWPLPPPG